MFCSTAAHEPPQPVEDVTKAFWAHCNEENVLCDMLCSCTEHDVVDQFLCEFAQRDRMKWSKLVDGNADLLHQYFCGYLSEDAVRQSSSNVVIWNYIIESFLRVLRLGVEPRGRFPCRDASGSEYLFYALAPPQRLPAHAQLPRSWSPHIHLWALMHEHHPDRQTIRTKLKEWMFRSLSVTSTTLVLLCQGACLKHAFACEWERMFWKTCAQSENPLPEIQHALLVLLALKMGTHDMEGCHQTIAWMHKHVPHIVSDGMMDDIPPHPWLDQRKMTWYLQHGWHAFWKKQTESFEPPDYGCSPSLMEKLITETFLQSWLNKARVSS